MCMTNEERISLLEFRQELSLRDNGIDRLFLEANVTREQYNQIIELMSSYLQRINNNEDVFNHRFERDIYNIVPSHDGIYHFAEEIAQEFHRQGQFREVFVALYGDALKFKYYLEHEDEFN